MGKSIEVKDWERDVEEIGQSLAEGKLPGSLGLAQDLLGHWTIAKPERGLVAYAKATMDSLGSVYTYYHSKKNEHNQGREPAKAWLSDHGYKNIFNQAGNGLRDFIRYIVNNEEFTWKQVRPDERKKRKKLGTIIEGSFDGNRHYYYLPGTGASEQSVSGQQVTISSFWAGPYIKEDETTAFISYLRELLWKIIDSDVAVLSVSEGMMHNGKAQIIPVSSEFDYTSGDDDYNNITQMAERSRAFLSCGLSRTIMFHGPPGTGKTTIARALAKELGGKSLIVDHRAIGTLPSTGQFVLWIAAPAVLIFNDIDRSDGDELRDLLQQLELRFKEDNRTILTCLSANDLSQLDPALLRPGRVSEVVSVPEPSEGTRRKILDYYISKYGLSMDKKSIKRFMKETAGFSPADVHEFTQVAKAVGPSLAMDELVRIKNQRELYSADACKSWNETKKSVRW